MRNEDVRACDGKKSRTKKEKDGLLCALGRLASREKRTTLSSRDPSVHD